MKKVYLTEMPVLFDEAFSMRPYDENHVVSLSKALKEGDSLPLPKVAVVEGKLVVLSGNHTLVAMTRSGKSLEVLHLGELDYLSAIKVVLESNPVGYKPPSFKDLQSFLSRVYLKARQLGISRTEFISFAEATTGRSQRTIYRMLGDVFKSEDEQLKHNVFTLLASGKSMKVVADALGVSISTIKRWLKTRDVQKGLELPPLRILKDEKTLTEDFINSVKTYLEVMPGHKSVDGLFLWLCKRYSIDPKEWCYFTEGIREYLPQDLISALGVGGKQYFLTKERMKELKKAKKDQKTPKEENLNQKKEKRITLRGVRSELSKIQKNIENIVERAQDHIRQDLLMLLSQLSSLQERVEKSLVPNTPQEVTQLVREGLDMIDNIHRYKTGYKLLNRENYGKYFNLLRPSVSTFLKRYQDVDKVKRAMLVAFIFNAYIQDREWAEFLKYAVEKVDWLKHRFSIGQDIWSRIMKMKLDRESFIALLEDVSKALESQKSISSPSSSSELPASSEPTAIASFG